MNQKVAAGETETVTPLEDAPTEAGASNVVDLTELLAKSLAKRKPASPADGSAAAGAGKVRKGAAKSAPRKRA